MKNLKAEMVRRGLGISDLQQVLGCSEKTVRNKLNGVTEFTIRDAIEVRNNCKGNSRFHSGTQCFNHMPGTSMLGYRRLY